MSEDLPKQELLIKLLKMSTSPNDGEALIAVRKANELLKSAGWDWEKLVNGKIKVVQFWHMRAIGGPVRKLAYEIKAVKWLPLQEAIEALTRTHEKIFLANVGPVVLKTLSQRMGRKSTGRHQSKRGRRGPSSIPLEQLLAAGY